MSWPYRSREVETYRYSFRSYGCEPEDEARCSRCGRRCSVCDKSRRPSYTTTYGTYICPPIDRAWRYCSSTPEPDREPSCSCGCGGEHKCSWAYRPARRLSLSSHGRPSTSRTVIDVVDWTCGPLALRHGSKYPVSLAPHATTDDIISMLAPDRHRSKVTVKWRDGVYEDLDDMISVDEIRRFARKLHVKDRRRHVRWE